MSNPVEQREKMIKAAEKARLLISRPRDTDNFEVRATVLHDRVSEGIKTICAEHSAFDARQTEALTEISVHLALLFDQHLQPPDTFLKRLRHEVGAMGAVGRLAFLGGLVALTIGLAQIAHWGFSVGKGAWSSLTSQSVAGHSPERSETAPVGTSEPPGTSSKPVR
jgi:hypothetical protein